MKNIQLKEKINKLISDIKQFEDLIRGEIEQHITVDRKVRSLEEVLKKKKKSNSDDLKVQRYKKKLQLLSAKLNKMETQRGKVKNEVVSELQMLKRSFYGLHQRLLQERQDQATAIKKVKKEIVMQEERAIKALKAPLQITPPDMSDDHGDGEIPDDVVLDYKQLKEVAMANILRKEKRAALRRKKAEEVLKKRR